MDANIGALFMISSTGAMMAGLRGVRPRATSSHETASGSTVRAWCSIPRYAIVAALFTGGACHTGSTGQAPIAAAAVTSQVANLHAFARLYGVVRWFHPSDAAAAIDWDRFAIEGARRVIYARDGRALRAVLAELIAPIAPTVHMAAPGEQFPDEPALHPASAAGLDVVAWEHNGFGDSTLTSVYASKRRHRERTVAVRGVPSAALWQALDAGPFRGARLRLRGKLHAAGRARGQLWLRVERGDATGFFDNMEGHPVVNTTWEPVEIIGTVDADATRIVFGTIMGGAGTAWYDDIELATQGSDGAWKQIEIKDPGFESGNLLASWSPGIGKPRLASLEGWHATLDPSRAASGSASLRVEAATEIVTDELFADTPAPGETVDVELGGGLRARVPLALYSKDGHTLGDDPAAAQRAQAGPPDTAPAGFDVVAGIADVIVAWNVLEHFWPYWNIVSVDWAAELDTVLADALADRSVDDHVATLKRLSAAAPDAHASTTCRGESRRAPPPFAVDVIEEQVVVTATADKAIARGDVIVSVDGRPAAEQLAAAEALASGSPQWRLVRARQQFGAGPVGSTLALRLRRGGTDVDVTVARGDKLPEQFTRPSIDRLDDGVYYVDLARAAMADLDAVMDRLATAPGVVFDLRGYPSSNHKVLSHLLTGPDDSGAWMAVPHVIRPDHVSTSMPTWETFGWGLPVLQPHIAGRIAFLTGPGAASYAESVMGLVEHYHLGEIVGAATAGTNGNKAEITEPTGCRTTFTGMRVTKHDGARQHLVGIQPTIPAARTIAGVIAGRDEILEKALAYVRGASK
jgi:C-terminal processing protease CtpA/Prc